MLPGKLQVPVILPVMGFYNINLLAQVPQDGELSGKFELFKEQVLKTGAVTAVNQSSQSMTSVGNWVLKPDMSER
jgi:hypothetical protein